VEFNSAMLYVLTLRSNRADSLKTDRARMPIAPGAISRPAVAIADHVFSNIIAVHRKRSPKTPRFQHSRQESQGRSSEYWNKKSSSRPAPKHRINGRS
jgi:hypothetical protein